MAVQVPPIPEAAAVARPIPMVKAVKAVQEPPILRYASANNASVIASGATLTTVGSDTIATYKGSGRFITLGTAGNLNLTAGTMTFASPLGTTSALGDVSLTSANAFTLPSVSAASLTATAMAGNQIFTGASTLTTTNGPITINNGLTLGGNTTFNAGSGTISFNGAVNGGYNLNANAGTFSFASALGGTTALNALSLTSTNALTLPSINAASISCAQYGRPVLI